MAVDTIPVETLTEEQAKAELQRLGTRSPIMMRFIMARTSPRSRTPITTR